VGTIDVDTRSGAILAPEQSQAAIEARAAELAAGLPPYAPNQEIAAEYLASDPVTALNR